MIIPINGKTPIVGRKHARELQRSRNYKGGSKTPQRSSPQAQTQAVLVPDEDGTLIHCYATVIDESGRLGRLLRAPHSGPFSDGELIRYYMTPNNSIPVVTVGYGLSR